MCVPTRVPPIGKNSLHMIDLLLSQLIFFWTGNCLFMCEIMLCPYFIYLWAIPLLRLLLRKSDQKEYDAIKKYKTWRVYHSCDKYTHMH